MCVLQNTAGCRKALTPMEISASSGGTSVSFRLRPARSKPIQPSNWGGGESKHRGYIGTNMPVWVGCKITQYVHRSGNVARLRSVDRCSIEYSPSERRKNSPGSCMGTGICWDTPILRSPRLLLVPRYPHSWLLRPTSEWKSYQETVGKVFRSRIIIKVTSVTHGRFDRDI